MEKSVDTICEIARKNPAVVTKLLQIANTIYYGNISSGTATIAKYTVQAADSGITLTGSDFGKTITVNSASAETIYLPSVSSTDIGAQFSFVKLGAGNLTIVAADSDIIADSTAGGTIVNDTAAQTFATMTLRLVTDTKWVLMWGDGTWTTD